MSCTFGVLRLRVRGLGFQAYGLPGRFGSMSLLFKAPLRLIELDCRFEACMLQPNLCALLDKHQTSDPQPQNLRIKPRTARIPSPSPPPPAHPPNTDKHAPHPPGFGLDSLCGWRYTFTGSTHSMLLADIEKKHLKARLRYPNP